MKFIAQLCHLEQKRIVLASQSPRRIELLRSVGLEFEIFPPQIEEIVAGFSDPLDYVRHNAREKVFSVQKQVEADLIIGADTVVVLDDQILEKPQSREQAHHMLKALSDRTHEVITGIAFLSGSAEIVDHEITEVTFYPLSDAEIESYLNTDEPFDKAGAYGIQGFASVFIRKIDGCYFNVVGFPLGKFYQHLKTLSF